MTDRDVLVFSRERDRVSSLPADHTSGLLLHADGLGEQREFTHDLHNDPRSTGQPGGRCSTASRWRPLRTTR
ncbi:hypothetical protein [Streptomyces flaveolus]|uniref:hypothetical protein n=1 Tax=Streptomyces flaveolus TaxID=67297 RepID=UPI00167167D6|nr:hypothetical protein [Streptomyces flaveolus]